MKSKSYQGPWSQD